MRLSFNNFFSDSFSVLLGDYSGVFHLREFFVIRVSGIINRNYFTFALRIGVSMVVSSSGGRMYSDWCLSTVFTMFFSNIVAVMSGWIMGMGVSLLNLILLFFLILRRIYVLNLILICNFIGIVSDIIHFSLVMIGVAMLHSRMFRPFITIIKLILQRRSIFIEIHFGYFMVSSFIRNSFNLVRSSYSHGVY